jgi:hypothetical protein
MVSFYIPHDNEMRPLSRVSGARDSSWARELDDLRGVLTVDERS